MTTNRKILIAALILTALCITILMGSLIYQYATSRATNPTQTPILVGSEQQGNNLSIFKPTKQVKPDDKVIPFQSVVLISALYAENGTMELGWTGSGTFISSDGLILTNAHVVLPGSDAPVDMLTIAPTMRDDQKPDPTYIAKVVQADPNLDIAIIKIVSDLNGNPVDPARLNFPAIALGDSDKLSLGDRLTILGYPGIGGNTITLTSGEVAGFTGEAGYGNRAYIKTSATIAGGNSGGLAADENGAIVGIPTILGSGLDTGVVDCRNLADTNNDGFIDSDDTCIPTGGFINSLRPINLALPLIEAARRGEEKILAEAASQVGSNPENDGTLFTDDFSSLDSGWTIQTDTDGYVGYADGGYMIAVTGPSVVLSGTSNYPIDDVVMDISARVVQSTGNGDFGLICRQYPDDTYYALEVREDGYASIWKNISNTEIQLTDWQYIQLPEGTSVFNLAGYCVGNQLGLSINGRQVLTATDSELTRGNTGLIAGTMSQGGLVVSFDDFHMRKAK